MLHLVTDRRRLAPGASNAIAASCLIEQTRHAVAAGIDMIQVRERDLDGRPLAHLVAAVLEIARGSRTRVVVNDRVDVALATGADGVHLRSGSFDARALRTLTPPGFVIGRSVHGADEVKDAGPVDYLIAGTVWPTGSKPSGHALLGTEGLAAVARAALVPVLGIGGITVDRLPEVATSGAAGVAGIGLFIPGSGTCRARSLHNLTQSCRTLFGAANIERHA